jgi:hypothetical protein
MPQFFIYDAAICIFFGVTVKQTNLAALSLQENEKEERTEDE